MESLKLLLLLHSVLEDPREQQALLDLLLPSALAAASSGSSPKGAPQVSPRHRTCDPQPHPGMWSVGLLIPNREDGGQHPAMWPLGTRI